VLVVRSARAGLALCFGASTVTLGSELELAVCDTAGPHSNIVERIATAEGATKFEDNLIIMCSQIRDGHAVPMFAWYDPALAPR
jgi:hypothetical protein